MRICDFSESVEEWNKYGRLDLFSHLIYNYELHFYLLLHLGLYGRRQRLLWSHTNYYYQGETGREALQQRGSGTLSGRDQKSGFRGDSINGG